MIRVWRPHPEVRLRDGIRGPIPGRSQVINVQRITSAEQLTDGELLAIVLGTGLAYLLVAGTARSIAYKIAVALALLAGFLLIWVNGAVGIIVAPRGRLQMVFDFTIENGKIVAVEAITDPNRLRDLELAVLD